MLAKTVSSGVAGVRQAADFGSPADALEAPTAASRIG